MFSMHLSSRDCLPITFKTPQWPLIGLASSGHFGGNEGGVMSYKHSSSLIPEHGEGWLFLGQGDSGAGQCALYIFLGHSQPPRMVSTAACTEAAQEPPSPALPKISCCWLQQGPTSPTFRGAALLLLTLPASTLHQRSCHHPKPLPRG